ncbi:MAG: 16S rRNA (cytosine(967)-C(5))-methyltransferase RsmB [Solirubrobacteraceae bacterium]
MSSLSAASVTPARRVAFVVLRRVFEQGAFADRALHAEAADLDPRERAFATALTYGAVQRRGTLDHLIGRWSSRPLPKLDPPVVAALRLGLFQLLFMDGVATHAAVNESVELVKREGKGGAQLVNALLRRATREGADWLAGLSDADPASAALLHSVPDWLAELWWRELGETEARALLGGVNEPAESALRVNPLVASAQEVLDALPVAARRADAPPEAIVLDGSFDAFSSGLFARGAIMPQSRGSMTVARALSPTPGARVLDLCAAPGGKTTHLAALMRDEGEVVAVDRHPGRAAALERTCERMHTGCVRVLVADAAELPGATESFSFVLVDPPCSGLGTLQSRPDLRWRVRPESIMELGALQARILTAGAAALAPGGALVYSVCTISRAEGDGVIDAFLSSNPEFVATERRQLLPHRDGTDGFFIARLHRRTR